MEASRVRVRVPVPVDLAESAGRAAVGWHGCELVWREVVFAARLAELEESGPVGGEERRRLGVAVRRDAAARRAGRWPTVDELVALALAARLGEPDMAGPWRPLSSVERAQARRPGRRPFTSYAAYGDVELDGQLAASLPADLVWAGRTAAYRWNERETAPRLLEAGEDREQRAQVYAAYGQSLGRLVREGLDRHLAVPPTEPDPEATVATMPASTSSTASLFAVG